MFRLRPAGENKQRKCRTFHTQQRLAAYRQFCGSHENRIRSSDHGRNTLSGQDLRYWKLDDVYEVTCVHCGAQIEFFEDDPRRLCKACGKHMLNPRNDMSCAQWCKHAKACLESLGADPPEFH